MGGTEMTTLVERVARAICEADSNDPDGMVSILVPNNSGDGLRLTEQEQWKRYISHAKGAIAAMNEKDSPADSGKMWPVGWHDGKTGKPIKNEKDST